MAVYDCDDEEQFEELRERVDDEDLSGRLLLQSFAPDTLAEARNRGFRPANLGTPLLTGGDAVPESDL